MFAAQAQDVPQGMQYQAIARDPKGDIVANQPISLKISLLNPASNNVFYVETHDIITSQLGLFNLVIGGGRLESGSFNTIPWGTDDVWLQVSIKTKGQTSFTLIGNNKLFTVPYAFHAGSAKSIAGTIGQSQAAQADACGCNDGIKSVQLLYLGSANATIKVFDNKDLKKQIFSFTGKNNGDIFNITAVAPDKKLPNSMFIQINGSATVTEIPTECNDAIVGETFGNLSVISRTDVKNGIVCSVCDIKKDWKVGGNVVLAACNMLGSKNKTDLVVITDNTERIRVRTNGDVEIKNTTQSTTPLDGALTVAGGVGIAKNLNVVGTVSFKGDSKFGGQLHITDPTQSADILSGALIVDGGTGIAKNLNVGGTTNVTGATSLTSTLDVTDATHLKSTLVTDGATNINNSLNVTKSDPNFVVTIINTDNGEGDGLKIKLGKAKTALAPRQPFDEAGLAKYKDLLSCDYPGNKSTLFSDIIRDGIVDDVKSMAGIAVSAGNMIINVINNGLSLPLEIGPFNTPAFHILNETVLYGGLHVGLSSYSAGILPDINIPKLAIPALDIPPLSVIPNKITVMPRLPQVSLAGIGIADIPIFSLDFWDIPSICLSDNSASPLNNKNEFISFTDKNDVQMGSIRGASVTDWAKNYLNPIFLNNLRGALTSSKVDKLHAQYHFKSLIIGALKNYETIGVEYTSGNGDYAEWLERLDKNELISAGDIVAVKGGKITKDLKGAEQIMAVSSNPIILGNTPAEGKNYLGNVIAFMGQVPVKILGPVSTGDYILGQSNTPGYGIAKHPNQMLIEDYKNAVGRSWANDLTEEPKMVNTVVGIHNNGFLDIIKDLKQKQEVNDERLKAIETKLYMSAPLKSKISGNKALK